MIRYKKGCIKRPDKQDTYFYKQEKHNNEIFTFDTENSSGWMKVSGEVIEYSNNYDSTFYSELEPVMLTYICMFGVGTDTYYCRYLHEVKDFFTELQEKYDGILTIWVHNLAYDFQAVLLNIFQFDKIFARSPHKVIYADVDSLRFRCSYFLTHMSLETLAIQQRLPVKKLVGELDYNIIRTPRTQLTEKELEYCEHDILCLFYVIEKYRKKYDKITKIPLTQTGEVRQDVKRIYHDDNKHKRLYSTLVPRNAQEYAFIKLAFAGGWTHANYMHVGKILKNVHSYDICSSYPFVMCSEKFPVSPWCKVNDYKRFLHKQGYVMLLDVTFQNLQSRTLNTYLSYSKAYEISNCIQDNGRIAYAEKASFVLTDVDMEIIEQTYSYDIQVNRAYVACAEYLDKKYIEYILKLFAEKTQYKGLDEFYDTYMYSKQRLNSLYGMMVTAIIQENVLFDGTEWSIEELTQPEVTKKLQELRTKTHKNILSYSQGIFVTAYARKNLWTAIIANDANCAYGDTDSVKLTKDNPSFFKEYNEKAVKKLHDCLNYYNIPISSAHPISPKGKECVLGIYEHECVYDEFKTLGAKRYAYKIGDDIGITVAGVSKEKGVKALKGSLNNFNENMVFDYEECKRLVMTYVDDMSKCVWNKGKNDEYVSKQRYGINALPSTYTMGMSDDFLIYLSQLCDFKDNFKNLTNKQLHKIAESEVRLGD